MWYLNKVIWWVALECVVVGRSHACSACNLVLVATCTSIVLPTMAINLTNSISCQADKKKSVLFKAIHCIIRTEWLQKRNGNCVEIQHQEHMEWHTPDKNHIELAVLLVITHKLWHFKLLELMETSYHSCLVKWQLPKYNPTLIKLE